MQNEKLGWIGVDFGTSSVKIAQVERNKKGWNLVASAVVPREQSLLADQAAGIAVVSSLNELQVARSLQESYQGRRVAATLPMSICDVHRLDCDLQQESNAPKILRRAIETAIQQSAEHLQYDYWSSPAVKEQPAWSQALAVPRDWTDQLCQDVAQVGWTCQAIDGLPLTLTRAVNAIHPVSATAPIAALDWGNGRATLCVIENGQATYVRCLKNCHTRGMLTALTENLNVTGIEAQRLLDEYGLSSAVHGEASEIAQFVQEIISEMLHQVIDELLKSFSHFKFLRRTSAPQHLVLFGGGAMIRDLGVYLSATTRNHSKQLATTLFGKRLLLVGAPCRLPPRVCYLFVCNGLGAIMKKSLNLMSAQACKHEQIRLLPAPLDTSTCDRPCLPGIVWRCAGALSSYRTIKT